MVETFTPAVCGSRSRQRLAIALFALAALVASAVLGATLGFVGSLVGTRPALIAAAALAFLAALREAGILRLPLPQSRRQVPERWQYELPLPLWSAGYGAGLGLGFLTFQPVATFWVACAAALALGKPASRRAASRSTERGARSWPSGRGTESRTVRPPSRDSSDAPPSSRARTRSCSGSRSSFSPSHRLPAPLSPRSAAASTRPPKERRSRGPAWTPGPQGARGAARPGPDGHGEPGERPRARRQLSRLRGRPGNQGDRLAQRHSRARARRALFASGSRLPAARLHPRRRRPRAPRPRRYQPPNPDQRRYRLSPQRSRPRPPGPSRRTARLAPHRPRRLVESTCSISRRNKRHAIERTNVDGGEPVRNVEAHRLGRAPPAGLVLWMKWFGSKRTKTLMHVSGRKTILWTTALTGRNGLCDQGDSLHPKSSGFAGTFPAGGSLN